MFDEAVLTWGFPFTEHAKGRTGSLCIPNSEGRWLIDACNWCAQELYFNGG